MREFPEEEETIPEGLDSLSRTKRPKLWYGSVVCIDTERLLTLADVTPMVPFNSMELSSMLAEAIQSNPSLAMEEWIVNSARDPHWGNFCMQEEERDIAYPAYLLGYPDFAQEDPRPAADLSAMLTALKEGKGMEAAEAAALAPVTGNPKSKYILLWQFESGEEMMWGEFGVCNLFIDPVDLAARRFDRVLYNWDYS
ncbi:hypothetical protein AGDE_16262 [Angomonas deanei]|nr:hypothetical protein AGDE_16262 [Angomonas deanei]|eukprot:EPY17423.1 hypothetical protein AGDE_16262 [Angomonas deanei]